MLKRNWLTVLVLGTVLVLAFGITSVFAHEGEGLNGEEWGTEGYCGGEEMTEEMMGDFYDHAAGCEAYALDGPGGTTGGGMMGGGMMGNW